MHRFIHKCPLIGALCDHNMGEVESTQPTRQNRSDL